MIRKEEKEFLLNTILRIHNIRNSKNIAQNEYEAATSVVHNMEYLFNCIERAEKDIKKEKVASAINYASSEAIQIISKIKINETAFITQEDWKNNESIKTKLYKLGFLKILFGKIFDVKIDKTSKIISITRLKGRKIMKDELGRQYFKYCERTVYKYPVPYWRKELNNI